MTLQEIRNSDKALLTPQEVAEALGVNPQSLRSQAQSDPIKLGFPVIVAGTRTLIPRMALLYFLEFGRPTGG